jgi:peptidoglycan/xylan/chitin deacetylase (PgdA/CDA1 family)
VTRVAARGAGALAAARLLAGGRVRAQGAVVLAYHDVRDDPGQTVDLETPPARFRAQLLHARSWSRSVTELDELCDLVTAGRPVDGVLAVSFDDALQGVYREAFPILAELGVPATVFAVSGHLGGQPPWWEEAGPLMTPSELEALARGGVTIGSHTDTHADLPTLDDAGLRRELSDSRAQLQDLVQQPVELLAYPFGHHDARVRRAARDAGYRAAFTFLNGRWTGDVDKYRVPRLTMSRQSTPRLAYHLARSAGSWPNHQLDTVSGRDGAPS